MPAPYTPAMRGPRITADEAKRKEEEERRRRLRTALATPPTPPTPRPRRPMPPTAPPAEPLAARTPIQEPPGLKLTVSKGATPTPTPTPTAPMWGGPMPLQATKPIQMTMPSPTPTNLGLTAKETEKAQAEEQQAIPPATGATAERLTGLAGAYEAGTVPPAMSNVPGGPRAEAENVAWSKLGFPTHDAGVQWAIAVKEKFGAWPWEGPDDPQTNLARALASYYTGRKGETLTRPPAGVYPEPELAYTAPPAAAEQPYEPYGWGGGGWGGGGGGGWGGYGGGGGYPTGGSDFPAPYPPYYWAYMGRGI